MKMLKLFTVELLLVLVFFFVKKGESLKCLVCRSDVDKGCNEKNSTHSKECPVKEKDSKIYCRKINQKLKFKGENSWTSIRECAYERGHLACYQYKWLDIAYQETCECEGENCNIGNIIVPNILTIVLIFSLVWIFSSFKTDNT